MKIYALRTELNQERFPAVAERTEPDVRRGSGGGAALTDPGRRGGAAFLVPVLSALSLVVCACGAQSALIGEQGDGLGGSDAAAPEDDDQDGTDAPGDMGDPSTMGDANEPPMGDMGDPMTMGDANEPPMGDMGDPMTMGDANAPPMDMAPVMAAEPCANTTPVGVASEVIAARLSELFGVAVDDELRAGLSEAATYGEVECQARRLAGEEEARATLKSFVSDALEADHAVDNPGLSAAVLTQMEAEFDALMARFVAGDATLPELLTATDGLVGPELAEHYGAEFPEGEERAWVEVPGRVGLLTAGLPMSSLGRISRRGDWVNGALLCVDVGTPPPPASQSPVPEMADRTYREVFDELVGPPACAACHEIVDGPGLALESYDALGVFQTTEFGLPIDSSGAAYLREPIGDSVATVTDTADLMRLLSGAPAVANCLAQKLNEHQGLSFMDPWMDPNVVLVGDWFMTHGQDLRELFVGLTQVESFWASEE